MPGRSEQPMTCSTARCADMNKDHASYEQLASGRRGTAEYREGYAEARRAFLIGQARPRATAGPGPVPDRARRPA